MGNLPSVFCVHGYIELLESKRMKKLLKIFEKMRYLL